MKKIGIIGFGNMGSAIAERAKAEYQIIAFDKDNNKVKNLSGISIGKDVIDLVNKSEVIILAVKPQDFEPALNQIKNNIVDKLVVSIAAGITTNYIEKHLGRVRVIRVMPNMPAKIGEGISCLSKGKYATDGDLDFTKRLFSYVGDTLILDESMINAATAISGSGPAYFCDFIKDAGNAENKKDEFIDKLTKAAISIGFNQDEAKKLSEATINGTILLLAKLNLSCDELIKQVASKGGTTEAALAVLHKGGFLEQAVKAALQRAADLSKHPS